MTAKDKAKELIDKYINLTEECDCLEYMCVCFSIPEYKAKQCALIAVEFSRQFITGDLSERFDKTMYLFDIKQEIEKL